MQKHEWRTESPIDSWNRINCQNKRSFVPKSSSQLKNHLLVLKSPGWNIWVAAKCHSLKEMSKQWHFIRKNFKILKIASSEGDLGKLAVSEAFWCPPCAAPLNQLPAVSLHSCWACKWARQEGCDLQALPGARRCQTGAGICSLSKGGRTARHPRDLWPPEHVHIILREPLGLPGFGTVGKDGQCANFLPSLEAGWRQNALPSTPRGRDVLFWCLTQGGHSDSRNLCLQLLLRLLLLKALH